MLARRVERSSNYRLSRSAVHRLWCSLHLLTNGSTLFIAEVGGKP